MPNRIPVSAAKLIAQLHRCRQVILLAWDGENTHIVTYGKSVEDGAQAAKGGNLLRQKFGWPESNLQPPIVEALLSRIAHLEAELTTSAATPDALDARIIRHT